MRRLTGVAFVACVAGSACVRGDRPAPLPPPIDSTALAWTAYETAGMDTIVWTNEETALARGGVVWRHSCERCHGADGQGVSYVQRGDTIVPPSLVAADWLLRDDPHGIRRAIFVGTSHGMPHWGLEGLHNYDVDAVTRYIVERLRAH